MRQKGINLIRNDAEGLCKDDIKRSEELVGTNPLCILCVHVPLDFVKYFPHLRDAQVQALTDKYNSMIDDMVAAKTKELAG